MWGCGLRPHPHIYPSLLLAGGFFSALIGIFNFLLKTHGLGFHEIPTHYQTRPRHAELLRQITYHHERIQNMLGNIPIFV